MYNNWGGYPQQGAYPPNAQPNAQQYWPQQYYGQQNSTAPPWPRAGAPQAGGYMQNYQAPSVPNSTNPLPPMEPPRDEAPPLPPEPPPPEDTQSKQASKPAPPGEDAAKLSALQQQAALWQQQQQQWQEYQHSLEQYQQQLQQWTAQQAAVLEQINQEEKEFETQYADWMKQYSDWKEQNKNHPNREQYDQYEKQWRQYEEQMDQKRKMISQRKQQALQNQQQAQSLPPAMDPAHLPVPPAPGVLNPPVPPTSVVSASAPIPPSAPVSSNFDFTRPPPPAGQESGGSTTAGYQSNASSNQNVGSGYSNTSGYQSNVGSNQAGGLSNISGYQSNAGSNQPGGYSKSSGIYTSGQQASGANAVSSSSYYPGSDSSASYYGSNFTQQPQTSSAAGVGYGGMPQNSGGAFSDIKHSDTGTGGFGGPPNTNFVGPANANFGAPNINYGGGPNTTYSGAPNTNFGGPAAAGYNAQISGANYSGMPGVNSNMPAPPKSVDGYGGNMHPLNSATQPSGPPEKRFGQQINQSVASESYDSWQGRGNNSGNQFNANQPGNALGKFPTGPSSGQNEDWYGENKSQGSSYSGHSGPPEPNFAVDRSKFGGSQDSNINYGFGSQNSAHGYGQSNQEQNKQDVVRGDGGFGNMYNEGNFGFHGGAAANATQDNRFSGPGFDDNFGARPPRPAGPPGWDKRKEIEPRPPGFGSIAGPRPPMGGAYPSNDRSQMRGEQPMGMRPRGPEFGNDPFRGPGQNIAGPGPRGLEGPREVVPQGSVDIRGPRPRGNRPSRFSDRVETDSSEFESSMDPHAMQTPGQLMGNQSRPRPRMPGPGPPDGPPVFGRPSAPGVRGSVGFRGPPGTQDVRPQIEPGQRFSAPPRVGMPRPPMAQQGLRPPWPRAPGHEEFEEDYFGEEGGDEWNEADDMEIENEEEETNLGAFHGRSDSFQPRGVRPGGFGPSRPGFCVRPNDVMAARQIGPLGSRHAPPGIRQRGPVPLMALTLRPTAPGAEGALNKPGMSATSSEREEEFYDEEGEGYEEQNMGSGFGPRFGMRQPVPGGPRFGAGPRGDASGPEGPRFGSGRGLGPHGDASGPEGPRFGAGRGFDPRGQTESLEGPRFGFGRGLGPRGEAGGLEGPRFGPGRGLGPRADAGGQEGPRFGVGRGFGDAGGLDGPRMGSGRGLGPRSDASRSENSRFGFGRGLGPRGDAAGHEGPRFGPGPGLGPRGDANGARLRPPVGGREGGGRFGAMRDERGPGLRGEEGGGELYDGYQTWNEDQDQHADSSATQPRDKPAVLFSDREHDMIKRAAEELMEMTERQKQLDRVASLVAAVDKERQKMGSPGARGLEDRQSVEEIGARLLMGLENKEKFNLDRPWDTLTTGRPLLMGSTNRSIPSLFRDDHDMDDDFNVSRNIQGGDSQAGGGGARRSRSPGRFGERGDRVKPLLDFVGLGFRGDAGGRDERGEGDKRGERDRGGWGGDTDTSRRPFGGRDDKQASQVFDYGHGGDRDERRDRDDRRDRDIRRRSRSPVRGLMDRDMRERGSRPGDRGGRDDHERGSGREFDRRGGGRGSDPQRDRNRDWERDRNRDRDGERDRGRDRDRSMGDNRDRDNDRSKFDRDSERNRGRDGSREKQGGSGLLGRGVQESASGGPSQRFDGGQGGARPDFSAGCENEPINTLLGGRGAGRGNSQQIRSGGPAQQHGGPGGPQNVRPGGPQSLRPGAPGGQSVRPGFQPLMRPGGPQSLRPEGSSDSQQGGPGGSQSMRPGGPQSMRPGAPQSVAPGDSMRPGAPQSMRPGGPQSMRPGAPQSGAPGDSMRPGAPQSVRPGGPQSLRPGAPQSGGDSRPGGPQSLRPGTPQQGGPNAPQSMRPGGPNAPQSIRPVGSSAQQSTRPGTPQQGSSNAPQSMRPGAPQSGGPNTPQSMRPGGPGAPPGGRGGGPPVGRGVMPLMGRGGNGPTGLRGSGPRGYVPGLPGGDPGFHGGSVHVPGGGSYPSPLNPRQQRPSAPKPRPDIASIDELLSMPGRMSRPARICIIVRGPPGAGKSYVCKLIKDKEVQCGGAAPRVLCLDDYFLVESEKLVTDETGKKVKKIVSEHEYDPKLEQTYKFSMLRSFKKQIDDCYFSFIIIDAVFDKLAYIEEFWSYAKQKGFQVYTVEMEADIATCVKRNTHQRKQHEIQRMLDSWPEVPPHYLRLDVRSLLQDAAIEDVEMEDTVMDDSMPATNSASATSLDDTEECDMGQKKSKWELDTSEQTLDKLDGIRKSKNEAAHSLEDYLQLPDDYETRTSEPGKKRVRWADIEERKDQVRKRELGFVMGQTDWAKITDEGYAERALNRTKYF